MPPCLHLSFHSKLSSHKKRQLRQVWAARSKSFGCKYDSTCSANSFGSNDMKSRWNCGSMIFIMWRTWVGSQCSIKRSTAIKRSTCDHCVNWFNQSDNSGGGLSRVGITERGVRNAAIIAAADVVGVDGWLGPLPPQPPLPQCLTLSTAKRFRSFDSLQLLLPCKSAYNEDRVSVSLRLRCTRDVGVSVDALPLFSISSDIE